MSFPDSLKRNQLRVQWLRVLPALLAATCLFFLAAPLIELVLGALGIVSSPAAESLADDQQLLSALWVSFISATCSTVFCLFLGYPLSYLLARDRMPAVLLVRSLLSLPLMLPHPVAGIALLLVLGPKGLLGAVFSEFGFSVADSVVGISLAMFFVAVPYVIRVLEMNFRAIDPKLELLAWNLGATPRRLFSQILWPASRRGVLSAAVLGFARSFSEFGAVVVLAYFPQSAAVLIWDRFSTAGLNAVLPATLVLLLMSFMLFLLWSSFENMGARDD